MEKVIVEDVRDYGKADLARTHRSTAGTQPAVDAARLDALLARVERDGFAVVEGLLSDAEVEEIRADVAPRFAHAAGRNNFEGFATRRLYGVIEKTFACNPLVEHPLVLGLLDRILEPNYLLSQLQAIDILPGEAAQPLHYDDGFYPWPRPRRALGAATIWAIDDFTEDNGATVVIPGSHLWGDRVPTAGEARGARPVVMPKRLLGYSIHPPFMGFVDGVHPKRVLERSDCERYIDERFPQPDDDLLVGGLASSGAGRRDASGRSSFAGIAAPPALWAAPPRPGRTPAISGTRMPRRTPRIERGGAYRRRAKPTARGRRASGGPPVNGGRGGIGLNPGVAAAIFAYYP